MPTAEGSGPVSLAFTEEMKGFLDFEETDHCRAFRAGEAAGRRLMFHVTVAVDDVERFLQDARDRARVAGWVRCEALGGLLDVEGGHFNLVPLDDRRRIDYRLLFRDPSGRPLALCGHREVHDTPDHDPWSGISPLYAGVHDGHEPDAPAIATAMLRIDAAAFARELTSFRVCPPLRLDVLARFAELFAGDLWNAHR
jgi:cholesterol oxidase